MMQGVAIIAIIFGGLVIGLAIVGSTILMAIRLLKAGDSRKGRKFQAEETRMIQEIYQGISRMEQRVEALETIMLDRTRKDRTS